jgi:hypothetical protein
MQIEPLVSVKPGIYMRLLENSMLRLPKERVGLNVGAREERDDYHIVLLDDELILVPKSSNALMEHP